MRTEREAKILVNSFSAVREKLSEIGAVLHYPENLLRRCIFSNQLMKDQKTWIRLRTEYVDYIHELTLVLKGIRGEGIHALEESHLYKIKEVNDIRIFLYENWAVLSQFIDSTNLDFLYSIENLAINFEQSVHFISESLGLSAYLEESCREEWFLNVEGFEVTVELDRWPGLIPWVEIEIPENVPDDILIKAFQLVGLNYELAEQEGYLYFGTPDIIYKERLGIDILEIETLRFNDFNANYFE